MLEYSTPKRLVPQLVVLSAKFDHVVLESESMAAIFQAPAFEQEPKLKSVLWELDKALKVINAIILACEKGETHPYHLLRSSMLPCYGWV